MKYDFDDDLYQDLRNETIARDDWKRRWPKACPVCGGWGRGPDTYEMHGFTHGPAEQIPGEPCEALEEGVCHRCGHAGPGPDGEHPLTEDGAHPCPNCGWNWDDGVPA